MHSHCRLPNGFVWFCLSFGDLCGLRFAGKLVQHAFLLEESLQLAVRDGDEDLHGPDDPHVWILTGDLILAKFSPEGKPYWTRNIGDSFLSSIADLGLDAGDNIHLAGSSILSADGRRTPTSFLTLKKLDSAGILLWGREYLGHRFPEHVSAIAVAASGQAYLTGVTFRYLTGDSVTMGDPHGYLMEVDSSGAVGFAKLQGTRIIGRGLGLDPKGNILMSGESTVNIERANSNGNQDMFLARYRSDGSRESIQFWGSRFNEWFAGMAVDRKGVAHIAGSSEGSPDGIRNKGSGDIFLVKFAPVKAKK